ncbi:MAG: hypothetical protein QXH42_01330 [Thermoplasmata archaeon]
MRYGVLRGVQLVLIFIGIAFIIAGLLQSERYVLKKDKEVPGTGVIVTEQVPPGSIMIVKSDSTRAMDTRVVKNDNREMVFVGNDTYFDSHLAAGGPPPSGNGVGKYVELWVWAYTETSYTISIKAPTESAIDYTEADVSYTVEVWIWTPHYYLILMGIVLISSTFVVSSVMGIGIFRAPAYRPRPREAPAPAEVPPVHAPTPPVAAPPTPEPAPAVRRAPPAPAPAPVPVPEPAFGPKYEVRVEAPPPAPARRGEPAWEVTPVRVERPPAPVEEPRRPLKKIKCSACGAIIPIYTAERPLRVTCPLCGRQGTLTR